MTALKLPAQGATAAWQRALPLLLALGALLWLFRDTAAAMVSIWSRSDTFAHAFLVPPISLALVWRRRAELARVAVAPSLPWLGPLALCCLVWLLGQLAGVHAAAQGALVAMVICAVPTVLGTRVARIIAFPLLFLFFGVPMGEFLIEPMMEGTADFTVAALRLTGIPVYREGLQFVIPSGNWSVVAACSGVRYLIASVMVGTLFAYLNFRSLKRRLAFVALAIIVPVLANWLRAYMIVMLGHLSSNKIAAGADHLIYGWIFFGVVILLMFMVGARFADTAPTGPETVPSFDADFMRAPAGARHASWLMAAVVSSVLVATQAVHEGVASSRPGLSPQIVLPDQLRNAEATLGVEWRAGADRFTDWLPSYRNAAATAAVQYRAMGGRGDEVVGVWVGLYRDQGYERKMVTSTNVLVDEASLTWLAIAQPLARVAPSPDASPVELRSAILRAPADPKVNPTQRLMVWRIYRVAGRFVAGDAAAMLLLSLQRLAGRGDDSAVFMIYTPLGEDGRGAERLQRFVSRHLGELAASVESSSTATGSIPERGR